MGHVIDSFDEYVRRGYRRWYRFGWKSPKILIARLRNKYRPVVRLRFAWQRAHRGYDDSMLWNLNYTVANLIVAGVQAMREWKHGYPGELTWGEWDAILARIEDGFQTWLDEDGWFLDNPEAEAKFKDGIALFGKWFGALWD